MVFTVAPGDALTPSMIKTVGSVLQYAVNASGPLSSPVGVEALAFMNNAGPTAPNNDYPDSEIVVSSYLPNNTANLPVWIGLTFNLHPRSRGQITITSNNPYDPPEIQPNYFSDPNDILETVAAINNTLRSELKPNEQYMPSS